MNILKGWYSSQPSSFMYFCSILTVVHLIVEHANDLFEQLRAIKFFSHVKLMSVSTRVKYQFYTFLAVGWMKRFSRWSQGRNKKTLHLNRLSWSIFAYKYPEQWHDNAPQDHLSLCHGYQEEMSINWLKMINKIQKPPNTWDDCVFCFEGLQNSHRFFCVYNRLMMEEKNYWAWGKWPYLKNGDFKKYIKHKEEG